MKITVIGAGYVGLVTSVCLAELGNEIVCVENNADKLCELNRGMSPIYEPGLTQMLQKYIEEGKLTFTSKMEEGVKFSDIIFVCVGTPESKVGKADLSQVEAVSREIAQNMDSYKLIIEKSTVPVNTHKLIERTIKRYAQEDLEFDVASNPEFLREGYAIFDFLNPDRIIVGVESDRAEKIFKELYKPFIETGNSLFVTKTSAAEIIKYASNSFLALKISYINMLADLCEKAGVDIEMLADGIGTDKRIGRDFLNAGIGYGGSCLPKDVKAFINIAKTYGIDFSLLNEIEKINKNKRKQFLEKVEDVLWITKNKKIAVWGLSFKPKTDDIREAPSIDIIKGLKEDGALLSLYDPEGMENFKQLFPEDDKIEYVLDKYDCLIDADALLLITEWAEFKDADLNQVKKLMKLPIIVDGRNIYNPEDMKEKGFEYYSMGR